MSQTQQEYVDLIKSSMLQALKKAVMQIVVKNIPLFGNFFFNPIIGFIVNKILTIAIDTAEMGAFFLYVDFRTSAQGKAYEQAAIANRNAQLKGTPNEKKLAEENLIKCLRDLVRLGN